MTLPDWCATYEVRGTHNMSKATEDQLAVLHGKVAETMTAALDQADQAALLLSEYGKHVFKEGETLPSAILKFLRETKEVNPSLLTSATKFLKDNNISCEPVDDEKLSELEERLKRKRKGNVTEISFK